MALTLSKIANNVASVAVAYNEDTVNIQYYPARITEKTVQELQLMGGMKADTVIAGYKALNNVLVTLIKSWDVYEDDAETVMYPLDADRLSELPINFRVEIVKAVMGDSRPNEVAPEETTQS